MKNIMILNSGEEIRQKIESVIINQGKINEIESYFDSNSPYKKDLEKDKELYNIAIKGTKEMFIYMDEHIKYKNPNEIIENIIHSNRVDILEYLNETYEKILKEKQFLLLIYLEVNHYNVTTVLDFFINHMTDIEGLSNKTLKQIEKSPLKERDQEKYSLITKTIKNILLQRKLEKELKNSQSKHKFKI